MTYDVSTEILSKLVEYIKEIGLEKLDLSTVTKFLDEIKRDEGNDNTKRCRWIYERGAKVGKQCPNTTVEGLPYCKDCKKKVKAMNYMTQHGYITDGDLCPNRPTNQLKKPIKGRVAKINSTKYYAVPIANHPEYMKEQTFSFVLRTTTSGEVYAEAVYDDSNKTLRNLTSTETKVAISKKYLVSENGGTDLVSLKSLIYPSKSKFCGSSMTIDKALDNFKLDNQDE